jgi:NAD(P)-dependent dehydrogenase (short-subunit alcohol dehydrogenase family)
MDALDGKICLITGAGSGIGASIARRFAREGVLLANANEEQTLTITHVLWACCPLASSSGRTGTSRSRST